MASDDLARPRFFGEAESFCEILMNGTEKEEWTKQVLLSLSRVYYEALSLSPVELTGTELKIAEVSYDEWKRAFDHVSRILGKEGAYWCVLENGDCHEPVQLPIANDLADVFRDLQKCLRGLTTGASLADITWQVIESFETHWGGHAVAATQALHHIVFPI